MTTEKTPIRAKFQARFLPMIAPFMAAQDIRYYLNGFLIERAERGGVYLVATNGHALAAVHDPEGMIEGTDKFIIRRDMNLVRAAKPGRNTLPNSVLFQDGRTYVAPGFDLIGSDMETYVMPGKNIVEGNFPAWRKVLPEFAKLQPGMRSATVNPEYLGIFERVAKLGAFRFPVARFWQTEDAGTSIVIQVPSVPEFVGIVMPVRDDERNQREDRERLSQFKN